MKSNKAAGLDEISAEMLKHGGDCTVEMLTRLMNRCWQEGQVPRDWQEGVIVKLPKKGDLSNCNNWRGITLLSIPGKVCVRTEGGTTDFFNIITGVRQGCILSPFLFLITIDFVLRKTTGDGKEGIRWREESRLADLDFADDLALLSENNQGLQHLTTKLETSSGKVGLRVSSEKTKAMEVGNHTGQSRLNITVNNSQVEVVDQFTYLGSVISNSGEVEPDINCRRNLRRILKVRWQDHITNDEILNRAKSKPLSTIITDKRMQLAGHILRLPSRRHSKTAMTWVPHNGRRKRGRPKHTWRRTFQDDLRRANIPWEEAETVAADKKKWKLAADVPYGTGGTKV
ncbi:uncharacterized protein LOC144911640 [Branchiostoma floridae x Branchiostoma belcheri]